MAAVSQKRARLYLAIYGLIGHPDHRYMPDASGIRQPGDPALARQGQGHARVRRCSSGQRRSAADIQSLPVKDTCPTFGFGSEAATASAIGGRGSRFGLHALIAPKRLPQTYRRWSSALRPADKVFEGPTSTACRRRPSLARAAAAGTRGMHLPWRGPALVARLTNPQMPSGM